MRKSTTNRGIEKMVWFLALGLVICAGVMLVGGSALAQGKKSKTKPANSKPAAKTATKEKKESAPAKSAKPLVGPNDYNQWLGSPLRNNVSSATGIPTSWNTGFDNRQVFHGDKVKNVKWIAKLGSQTYGNPVVCNGRVFVGTNNGGGWIERYPATTDLGCLLCFSEENGEFLWQHSSEKIPNGRVIDWPLQGICCSPLVEGDRLWYVTSRGEIACLDTEGFHDDENDGPFASEKYTAKVEADVVWMLDMMKELGISQHNMCSCSITGVGDLIFVCTSNGVDESHTNIPAPDAPSFLCLNKTSGKILWTDKSPGLNILHGQWSSPALAEIAGEKQIIFAGGDGWLYSFKANEGKDGAPELIWKFDANPKTSRYILGGRGTRNELIATPVVYNDRVYIAVGQDPEHGEGIGHLWCIDPTKQGDISPELAVQRDEPGKQLPVGRWICADESKGEMAVPNPNSGMIWHYSEFDNNGDGEIDDFEEKMHRTIGSVAVKGDLLFIADFSGLFHCLDAKTGKCHWTHDLFSATWGSPLIVEDRVYMGDEEGNVSIFELSDKKKLISKVDMTNSVYSSPFVANGVLYVANKSHLFAIQEGAATDHVVGGANSTAAETDKAE